MRDEMVTVVCPTAGCRLTEAGVSRVKGADVGQLKVTSHTKPLPLVGVVTAVRVTPMLLHPDEPYSAEARVDAAMLYANVCMLPSLAGGAPTSANAPAAAPVTVMRCTSRVTTVDTTRRCTVGTDLYTRCASDVSAGSASGLSPVWMRSATSNQSPPEPSTWRTRK